MSTEQRLAISYCRKSTKIKGKSVEESVGYQQQEIKNLAKQKGLEIIREFSDVGYSGRNTDRPELKEMVEYLRNTEIEIEELIIYSIDRFGRDLQHNIKQIQVILDLVKVSFVTTSISSEMSYFKLMFTILTGVAQDERDRLLTRCASGRSNKIIYRKSFDGNYYPLGLIKEDDSETLIAASPSNIVDIGKNQELIQLQYIFYLYLFNYSLRKIATILNERFGKTKRGVNWSYKSVKYILQNPIYTGKLRGVLNKSNQYLIEGANVEKLIDSSTFIMVQKKLEFETTGRKRKDVVRNPFFNLCYRCGTYLVESKSLLSCHVCKESVDSTYILEEVKRQLMNIIKKQFNVEEYPLFNDISSLNELENEKLRIIKIEIKKLQNRLDEINSLNINQAIKRRMININTDETNILNKKSAEIEMKLDFLSKPISFETKNIEVAKVKEVLISTPFIILYDFIKKEVVLVLHNRVFGKEELV